MKKYILIDRLISTTWGIGMAAAQKTIGGILATILVVLVVGSALAAQNVFAVTDNSHKSGLKTIGSGVPVPIANCILQHLNVPKYFHVGAGTCIIALP